MSVRNALGLLARKPCYGYELRASLKAVVGSESNWDVKPAQIYTTLERLQAAGLVERESDLGEGAEPSRRIYAITSQGRDLLHEWFSSSIEPQHYRDEFYLKLMTALVSGEADVWRMIQTQRARLYQELHDATTQRETYNPGAEMAQILLMDKVIMHLEADLRWLDMAEVRLETIIGQPMPAPEIRKRGRPRRGE